MRNHQFILITTLLVLIFSANSVAASIHFKDVRSTHWAQEEIGYLAEKKIINGYGNGIFAPNDLITVEHGTLMVERVTKQPVSFPSSEPKKPLTRGEVALLLAQSFELPQSHTYKFKDVSTSSSYYEAINQLTSNQIALGYEDGSFKPDKSVTRAEFSVFVARILDSKYRKIVTLQQQAGQRITVTSTSKTTATVQLQQLSGDKWQNVNKPYQALIGKNGIGKTKEGDGKTPTGTFALGTGFGWGQPIHNPNYPFKKATANDYWIDDASSKDYNQWVTYSGDPKKKWKSFERMNHTLYKYGVVIRYNDDPIIPGRGSAIFLHTKNASTKHTLGCIALNEGDLITVMKWLNSDKNPIIIIK